MIEQRDGSGQSESTEIQFKLDCWHWNWISNVTQSLPVGLLQCTPVLTLQNFHLTKRKNKFESKKCGVSETGCGAEYQFGTC